MNLNKLKEKLLHQSWKRQANRKKKRAQEKSQESETHLFAHLGIP